VTEPQQGDPRLDKQHRDGADKHPLVIWARLSLGDVVAIQGLGTRDWVGTIESRTSDGLVIWIKDDLNKRRRSFHFRECQSVRVIQ
jgi:hypothetical protein